jgi:hypothetical protein
VEIESLRFDRQTLLALSCLGLALAETVTLHGKHHRRIIHCIYGLLWSANSYFLHLCRSWEVMTVSIPQPLNPNWNLRQSPEPFNPFSSPKESRWIDIAAEVEEKRFGVSDESAAL